MHLIYDNSFHVSMNPLAFVTKRFMHTHTLQHPFLCVCVHTSVQMQMVTSPDTQPGYQTNFCTLKWDLWKKTHTNTPDKVAPCGVVYLTLPSAAHKVV